MAQDALHYNFILNFRQQFICQPWVEDFFDCNRRPVQKALVDDTEAALTNLLADLDVLQRNFANARDLRQTASCR